jgi:iron complex outermembrane recepter protein
MSDMKSLIVLFILVLLLPVHGHGETEMDQFLGMDLDKLLELDISLVGRKLQKVKNSAAAVYVLTNQDIKKSGASNIQDALRMVPGMYVFRSNSPTWSVITRGVQSSTDFLMNKMLVLLDGRSIYSPLYGGVEWWEQDFILEDIDRIEIIRGPGATMWGANAMNGIINIVTRKSSETKGSLVSIALGDELKFMAQARYGGELSETADYRLYAKSTSCDGAYSLRNKRDLEDNWRIKSAGFRIDWDKSSRDNFMFQSHNYIGIRQSENLFSYTANPPYYQYHGNPESKTKGVNLLGRWVHDLPDDSNYQVQLYFVYADRDWFEFIENRAIYDIDFQHRFSWQFISLKNEITWGLGYRYSREKIDNTYATRFVPAQKSIYLSSAFIQDEITLIPDELIFTMGTKIEYDSYSKFEPLPSARLLWHYSSKTSFWTSVSRATRTPARSDREMLSIADPPNFYRNGNNGFGVFSMNNDFQTEVLNAVELGYRVELSESLALDLAIFENNYDYLGGPDYDNYNFQGGICLPSNTTPPCGENEILAYATASRDNIYKGKSLGGELAADWWLTRKWRVQASYSYYNLNLKLRPGKTDIWNYERPYERYNPNSIISIFSNISFDNGFEYSIWSRFVDKTGFRENQRYLEEVDSYITLDMRLAWKNDDGLLIALAGKNITEPYHQENALDSTAIERSVELYMGYEF